MASARSRFNFKRRFTSREHTPDSLRQLAAALRYGGNPEHKRHPGDFRLTPPSLPRDHKSLCDEIHVFSRAEALRLLRRGAERGMISEWDGTGFPRNIWSMTEQGVPLEAQLENPGNGTYHGYPLEQNDDFRECVIVRWNKLHERDE